MRLLLSLFCVAALLLVAGCATDAVNKDAKNTFLTADDLVTMTNKMAHSIAADADVAQVIMAKPMVVVLMPVQNESSTIIRGNEKELYVHRVRNLLAMNAGMRDKFVFVLNRADYEKLKAEEGLSADQLGPSVERIQPEYALTGTFYTNTNVSNKMRSDSFLCTFRLTKISGDATGVQLWEDKYEVSRAVKKEFLD